MNRDNPQETGLIGWFGGIVDGEGTISLTASIRKNRCKQLRVTPKVLISNTDPGIINKTIEILMMMGIGRYVRTDRSKPFYYRKDNNQPFEGKQVVIIEVTGLKRVYSLLDKINPYLFGDKKERARILMTFISQRFEKAEARGIAKNYLYDDEDIRLIMEFLRLTKTKRLGHYSRLLNEYTQNTRIAA